MRLVALLLALLVLVGCSSPSSRQVEDRDAALAPAVNDAGENESAADEPEHGEESAAQRADRRLAELREKFSFPIFVPTRVTEGLEPRTPTVVDNRLVRIAYLASDRSVELSVTVGPEGCCLDADPRKFGGGTPVRGGLPATCIPNQPEFGGPILWWNEDGAYIALSGPDLTEEDLVEIAESLSATATFTDHAQEPAPEG